MPATPTMPFLRRCFAIDHSSSLAAAEVPVVVDAVRPHGGLFRPGVPHVEDPHQARQQDVAHRVSETRCKAHKHQAMGCRALFWWARRPSLSAVGQGICTGRAEERVATKSQARSARRSLARFVSAVLREASPVSWNRPSLEGCADFPGYFCPVTSRGGRAGGAPRGVDPCAACWICF